MSHHTWSCHLVWCYKNDCQPVRLCDFCHHWWNPFEWWSLMDPTKVMGSGGISCWHELQREQSTVFPIRKTQDQVAVGWSTIPLVVSGQNATDPQLANCECLVCVPKWEWCLFCHSTGGGLPRILISPCDPSGYLMMIWESLGPYP